MGSTDLGPRTSELVAQRLRRAEPRRAEERRARLCGGPARRGAAQRSAAAQRSVRRGDLTESSRSAGRGAEEAQRRGAEARRNWDQEILAGTRNFHTTQPRRDFFSGTRNFNKKHIGAKFSRGLEIISLCRELKAIL